MVAGKNGPQVFTLEGSEHACPVLVESMYEGALTLTAFADRTGVSLDLACVRLTAAPSQHRTGAPAGPRHGSNIPGKCHFSVISNRGRQDIIERIVVGRRWI